MLEIFQYNKRILMGSTCIETSTCRKKVGQAVITLFATIILVGLLGLGIYEKRKHQVEVNKVPLRINVNGSRGKSTVTRLIAGVLMEDGIKTVGKMTGTAARMFYWDTDEERPIKRRPEGANIREQKGAMKEAADRGAEAFVSECMAVAPDYQRVLQENWMQANITVIVNVVEDHMEVMGPTLDHMVDAYKETIPYNGKLIISPSPYVEYFKIEARKRNTEVFVADTDAVPKSYLTKFEYMIFPENVALALAVAKALDIDENTAGRGMLKAKAAPGVTRVFPFDTKTKGKASFFVNGFSANEPASTLKIWENVVELGYPSEQPIIVMNCRSDRPERTEQFAKDLLPEIEMDKLIVIGEGIGPIQSAYDDGRLRVNELVNFEGYDANDVFDYLEQVVDGQVVYGIGNYHGAVPLIERLETIKKEA
ncbi:poly-gamma-glutamate synthase PgsB [Geomicrobium sediminis]|uniref:Poly-gamma-glutamate synthase PgsB/CapB n=1 Tax=Geomicrobium sediminis TaxID=1347788 RepID=A0ABS2P885_9BACL|nr:poly-gamma-glutamate synthase PgsB [Geomicrobium sediminis]MBM7631628.1 poly-gamma-glutamate synthase PgsB/CapB [Geomicrobium sediminis]